MLREKHRHDQADNNLKRNRDEQVHIVLEKIHEHAGGEEIDVVLKSDIIILKEAIPIGKALKEDRNNGPSPNENQKEHGRKDAKIGDLCLPDFIRSIALKESLFFS